MERRAFLATTGGAIATLHPEAVARARSAVARARAQASGAFSTGIEAAVRQLGAS